MRLIRFVTAAAAVLLLSSVLISASEPSYVDGEVVYHQDFSDISEVASSGIKKGTSSSTGSDIAVTNDTLSISTSDDGRVYAILPKSDWTDSFTVEFDFTFSKNSSQNGYLGVMLTSSGDEPGNISQVIIRAKGSVDDFGEVSDTLAESFAKGEKISVKIPVENGVLRNLFITANGITEELERTGLLVIGSGNRGFSARNAGVTIPEVYIVNGTEYKEKTGVYADLSYASDDTVETSPDTGDLPVVSTLIVAACSFLAIKQLKCSEK
ncbi:MAG: hypothetical protein E7638_02810 [Ruminococcaceae bacterium]|nr:hypothetical protein [Oscillospiraceae bacterium]